MLLSFRGVGLPQDKKRCQPVQQLRYTLSNCYTGEKQDSFGILYTTSAVVILDRIHKKQQKFYAVKSGKDNQFVTAEIEFLESVIADEKCVFDSDSPLTGKDKFRTESKHHPDFKLH